MKKILSLLLLFCLLLSAMLCLTSCGITRVKQIDAKLNNEQYAFGVNKQRDDILAATNAVLAEIKGDGTLDAIIEKYFSANTDDRKTYAAGTASTDPAVREKQLIVATNTPFSPFEYKEGDKFCGIDMEIAERIADALDYELVIVDMPFNSILTAIENGQADIAMAGLTVSAERAQQVNFSDTYYQASQVLICAEDCTLFDGCTTAADMEAVFATMTEDTFIGYQTSTTGDLYVRGDEDWGFAGITCTAKGFDSAALAVQALQNGQIDFVIVDEGPARLITDSANRVQRKWQIFATSFFDKGGWRDVLVGLKNTLVIAVLGLAFGVVLGTLLAAVRVMPKYKRTACVLDRIAQIYIAFFRGTPIVVQLLLGYFVLLPLVGLARLPAETACIIIFGLNSAAYVCEIMRAGLQSVDAGQMEAGRALGLSYGTTMRRIVIPQAIKNIIPTLGNEFISLLKETSVISFVGAIDLSVAFTRIGTNNYEVMVPYLIMAVCYILLIYLVTLLIRLVERLLSKSDRSAPTKKKRAEAIGIAK